MKHIKTLLIIIVSLVMLTAPINMVAGAYFMDAPICDAGEFAAQEHAQFSSIDDHLLNEDVKHVNNNSYSFSADALGNNFNAVEKDVYNELKAYITSVANSSLSSTKFTITADLSDLTWTKSELGCTIVSNGAITSAAKAALKEKLAESLDTSYIYQCLLADCSYELFWHDKTVGYTYSYSYQGNSSEMHITALTFSFCVSSDYSYTGATNTYRTSSSEIARAKSAANAAKAIVAKHKDKSDLEKLKKYIDEICCLNSYNHDAADNDGYLYGDPWQLVYVFDGDANTNVVCEGYAKAFKYLCDLSSFAGDVDCHIVRGEMTQGTKSGSHMWNVIRFQGENYLVDITAYDKDNYNENTLGDFLLGGTSSNSGKTHTVTLALSSYSKVSLRYTYGDNQKDVHCEGYLKLANSNYHVHKFPTTWVTNETQHWHQCFCGVKADVSNHADSVYPATCTRRATCDVCGVTHGEKLPHSYDKQIVTNGYLQSAATCTNPATYYYSCSCGLKGSETFEHGETLAHKYTLKNTEEMYLKSEANCTNSATYYYSCSCGAKGITTFAYGKALGHDYNTDGVCLDCGCTPETTPPINDGSLDGGNGGNTSSDHGSSNNSGSESGANGGSSLEQGNVNDDAADNNTKPDASSSSTLDSVTSQSVLDVIIALIVLMIKALLGIS